MVKSKGSELDGFFIAMGFLLLIAGMAIVQSSWLGYALMAAAVATLLYNVVRPRPSGED